MAGEQKEPGFDHLREHSIGLPQVLFQSITHMAPAAAVAYSIYISVPDAGRRFRSQCSSRSSPASAPRRRSGSSRS